ncbi:LysR family transcriptional regulator [Epibacterium sp. SM1979]|uniref:LysR family transcriptional regulator n=1 Tax=Tritonibacter litoralis TaxID=2662264 RepID=A0A843YM19_9RHOB|nr:LysR family transcriptional regulator [Tritonibacter litoralis]MQQ10292.1 LysR family transcriptional regulator [Tritonibacter litoralis]
MRQYDWNDLKLFLLFLRSGSTRRAGAMTGVSHSTVARRLEALSTLAGGPLFQRVSGRLEVTGIGQDVLTAARAIESEIIALDRRAFGQNRELEGPVVLSMGDVLAVTPMLSILARFCQSYPNIDLRIITSASLSDLDRREADLALRFSHSPSDHLVGRKLTQTARAIYASRDYVRRFGPDLAVGGAGWISFSPDTSTEGWKKATPFAKLPTHLRILDMRAQQSSCRAGAGIVMLPCMLCDPDPELVRITEPEFVPRQDLWLLRHAELRDNVRVRALRDHIVGELPDLLPLLRGETAETFGQDARA